jgi:hypothetical protein
LKKENERPYKHTERKFACEDNADQRSRTTLLRTLSPLPVEILDSSDTMSKSNEMSEAVGVSSWSTASLEDYKSVVVIGDIGTSAPKV